MKSQQFENLLGKNISKLSKIIGEEFENELFDSSFYYIKNESIKKNLYGMQYNSITVLTNEKDNIKSISIHFDKTINKYFYESFIEDYNKPNNILVIEASETTSEGFLEGKPFNQKLRKNNIQLREGKFDENPLFIVWTKEDYEVKFFFRYNNNSSEVTYRLLH
ncbi:hypothetical protein JM80_0508 [Cellulophaga sp. RHA_52]|uniref:hypothetical protein n=1 Tax=Cellulophaga TaxID=104264 RepID=UPI00119B8F3B|nr:MULTISPECIES: hypothetical protein [Cellulophaga]MDO6852218.1 hypothetical protein [Cellulophaga lytica]TVZ08025.1 hypothetical protein JM80_0508 [Cellulophaga sp. RHA_52]